MENWVKVSLLLCIYGFFRELRASEPFLTDFLSGKWRNLTDEQVNKDVYPWATYSYLCQLVIAFFITDILRYKPLIVLSACIGSAVSCILLWTVSLEALQTAEVLYGTFMATEVAYYTYIYAKVERDKYQQVTGYTRSAILAGRFLAGVIAQFFVSFSIMDLRELNYITLGSQIISLFWAIILPSVGTSMYFYSNAHEQNEYLSENGRKDSGNYENGIVQTVTAASATAAASAQPSLPIVIEGPIQFSPKRAIQLLWIHFKSAYTNRTVVQWSIWWALASCGFSQVQLYIQFLWRQTNPNHENIYNGAVEAALTLLGAFGALSAGYLDSKKFDRWDLWILTGCSALDGGLLLWAAFTDSVWISYIMYVLFGILFHFMITVASVNVAKRLNDDSFALIFGINTLLALIMQSLLTVVVISEWGFALDPRGQFTVYGAFFCILSIVYGFTGIFRR